jgi:hypothetical protein
MRVGRAANADNDVPEWLRVIGPSAFRRVGLSQRVLRMMTAALSAALFIVTVGCIVTAIIAIGVGGLCR